MLSVLSIAGILARARQIMSGPLAQAIAATVAALVVVGAIALGLAWLRGDAARDASAAAAAVCEADKLAAALEAEQKKTAALERAQQEFTETIERLTRQRALDEQQIDHLVAANKGALDAARKWEAAAGRRNDAVLRSDDPWLRRGAATADADRARGR